MVCGGKQYVTNVCMYATLFCLYSGIITQTARRRESVPYANGIRFSCSISAARKGGY